jgi:hypothetical protein
LFRHLNHMAYSLCKLHDMTSWTKKDLIFFISM